MVRHLFFSLFAVCFLSVAPMDAEAKRFGGGFSLGKSYSTPAKKPAAAPAQQQTAPTSGKTTTAPAKPGMGGLMGGLLAGGLLGALFFGGAFEGIQLMDILLIGLVVFMLYKLFLAPRVQPAYAGQSRPSPAMARTAEPAQGFSTTDFSGQSEIQTPDWFDRSAFLDNAVAHFKSLQSAWDRQDWDEISRFTSPALLQELKSNRAVLPENQTTDVVSVMVELIDFVEDETETVVSLNFHGWMRENGADSTGEFSEVWHLAKPADSSQGSWSLVGIQQY